jgi:hypothetical protein
MLLDGNDPVVQRATFGAQVEQFLSSDIGVYLIERADEQAEVALKELVSADPDKPDIIRAIQNRIKVADSIVGWLREAIQMGDQAVQQLREDA